MVATLIADDLTGACDAGAPFAGRCRVGVFVTPASPGAEWNVVAVDTETRGLAPGVAAERVRTTAKRLEARLAQGLVFKKIDSTLRGPVGAELDALLAASGCRGALVCPAFPAQQRTVVHGTLLVSGTPAHHTSIAKDPAYPGRTSDCVEIIGSDTVRPVSLLPLARVRGDQGELARAVDEAQGQIILADAETDADLDALARAALPHPELVLAGSAGLARAVAQAAGLAGARASLPDGRAWLIVVGSLHPATRAQLRALESAGVTGSRLEEAGDPDTRPLIERIKNGCPAFLTTGDAIHTTAGPRQAIASRLAGVAAQVLSASRPDLVVVSGGETALALLRALGAVRVELAGEPAPGLALGDAIVASARTLSLLTKAGGFGPPDLFLALLGGTP